MKYNFDKLSRESQIILANGYGYRNDFAYGSGVDNIFEIIDFEVFELGNNDVFYTCRELYDLKLDIRKKKECFQKIKLFLTSVFGTNKLYGLWLTSEDNVRKYYDGNSAPYISVYEIPKKYGEVLVISDLGVDGCLCVSKTPFNIVDTIIN